MKTGKERPLHFEVAGEAQKTWTMGVGKQNPEVGSSRMLSKPNLKHISKIRNGANGKMDHEVFPFQAS